MQKEDVLNVNLPESEDSKEEKDLETKINERSSRKREQVEEMFVKHYGLEKESPALQKLVDREMYSAKSFDKLIKQKKKWRSQAQEKGPEDKQEKPDTQDKKEVKSSFDRLREIEKEKATKGFLQGLVDKYPDKFKDKQAVSDAYEKIEKEYKEDGTETRREDFETNLNKAFRISHPDIYEDEIKTKERKRLLENDIDLPDVSSEKGGEKKEKGERKILKSSKVNPAKDWFKPAK